MRCREELDTVADAVRWGILGTANIARASFLPGLRAAGGRAVAVAGRDRERTEAYARANGVERAVASYETLVEDPEVEAVYVPLPNSLHEPWVTRALEAKKPVLCEKPLGLDLAQVCTMTNRARQEGVPLWEAFVFMFRPHFAQVQQWIADGAIGSLMEVDSRFNFQLRSRENIRLSPELGGGAVYDVGCYPVHLATLVFGTAGERAVALATLDPEGVDATTAGTVEFRTGRLLFSCSLHSGYDTFSRLAGSEGAITLSNPFHPGERDWMALTHGGRMTVVPAGDGRPSFTAQIEHIQQVVRGEAAPRWTAAETSVHTARTLDLIRAAAGLVG